MPSRSQRTHLAGMRPTGVSGYGCPYDEGPPGGGPSLHGLRLGYGQLDVRVTVFDVIGMPGTVGVLSESAEVAVAVAE
jgi:hypothetical protein